MASAVRYHIFDPKSPWHSRAVMDAQKFLNDNYPVEITKDDIVVLIAAHSQSIIGVSAMLPYDAGKVHVFALAVAPDSQRIGIGTEMLKSIAIMYPTHDVTLSITMDQAHLLNFYCGREYAQLREINTELNIMVLSLIQLHLLRDVPLP